MLTPTANPTFRLPRDLSLWLLTVALLAVPLLPGIAGAVAAPPLAGPEVPAGHPDLGLECTPHPSIHITEEWGPRGFVLEPLDEGPPIYRPGSGVVAGNGTAENPYIIEGWCIVPVEPWPVVDQPRPVGIFIDGTESHVRVQGNTLAPLEPSNGVGEAIPEESIGHTVENLVAQSVPTLSTLTALNDHAIDLRHASHVAVINNVLEEGDQASITVEGGWDNRIAGNRVDAATDTGILATDGAELTIEGNEILDAGRTAIELRDSGAITLAENVIRGGQTGLTARGVDHLVVEENEVIATLDEAIEIDVDGYLRLSGNLVEGAGDTAIVIEGNNTPVLVTGNTIRDSMREGLFVEWTPGATVAWNEIVGNRGAGIAVGHSPALVLERNVVQENSRGIDLYRSPRATVTANGVTANADGLRLFESDRTELTRNTLDNLRSDVRVWSSSELIMRSNELTRGLLLPTDEPSAWTHSIDTSNTVRGAPLVYLVGARDELLGGAFGQVLIGFSEGITVTGGAFPDTVVGVDIAFSRDIDIHRNTFVDNARSGIRATNTTDLRVDDNRFYGLGMGLRVDASSGITVRGNDIQDRHVGVGLYGVDTAVVQDNRVVDTHTGVDLGETTGTVVQHNWVQGAGWSGIGVSRTTGTLVEDNAFLGNEHAIDILDAEDTVFQGNNVEDSSRHGLVRWTDGRQLDAAGNWWNCPEGPGEPGCATVSGTNVLVAPWLTAPNPEAGPR